MTTIADMTSPAPPSPDTELIGTYIQHTASLLDVPFNLRTIVDIGWLARAGVISPEAAQEVFDALHRKGKLDVFTVCGLPQPDEKEPAKKASKAAKKATP